MLHVIRTSTGAFRAVEGKETTHVVMTNKEFHDYVNISRMLRDDIRHFSSENVKLHRKISDNAEKIASLQSQLANASETAKQLSRQKDELEQSVASIKKDLAKAKYALAHAESLNINLKRICRERANQARNLPKSSDYTVLVSHEWREKCQTGPLIRGFKTTIQSPYDAGMDDVTAKRQIFEDLINGVLADLGCPYYEQVNGRPKEPIEEMSMYRWVFTADFRSTFWNITIYTSGPLKVPPHRRPQQKPRNRGGSQNGEYNSGRNTEEGAEEGN